MLSSAVEDLREQELTLYASKLHDDTNFFLVRRGLYGNGLLLCVGCLITYLLGDGVGLLRNKSCHDEFVQGNDWLGSCVKDEGRYRDINTLVYSIVECRKLRGLFLHSLVRNSKEILVIL